MEKQSLALACLRACVRACVRPLLLSFMLMAFRQWIMACSGPAANRMEGLCARLRDAVHDNDDDDEGRVCGCGNDNDIHSIGHKSALWKDLTMSALEPTIPKEISVPVEDAMAISTMYSSLEDDSDSLVGLEILDHPDDEREGPSPNRTMMACVHPPYWRSTAECSWTYSTASSHGQDLADFMKFDDGSSYSSVGAGKPPRPTPPPHSSSSRVKSHHKTKSGGTATTTTSSWSRSGTWGGLII